LSEKVYADLSQRQGLKWKSFCRPFVFFQSDHLLSGKRLERKARPDAHQILQYLFQVFHQEDITDVFFLFSTFELKCNMVSRSSDKNVFVKVMLAMLLLLYSFFLWLMIRITMQYVPVRSDAAFLAIKQEYVHMAHYRIAFFVHVFSALLVLLAGYTQFSGALRIKFPLWHRCAGWLYVLVTLLLAGPSGLVIGIYANGGLSSQIAFCLLAVLWMVFTAIALVKIIKKQVFAHRAWMIRSFALALSAITLRAWKYILVALFHPRPMDVYQIVAWLGWTLNLVIAELIILIIRSHARQTTL